MISTPLVSVVIPVKNSEQTIRATVNSLLNQDYGNLEIIIVGDRKDSTFKAIKDLPVNILEVEPFQLSGRDANYKRNTGIMKASGEVIALIDSDCVAPTNWITKAIHYTQENQVSCLGGLELGINGDTLSHYTDNTLLAKTPRFPEKTIITKENFGQKKLPITANLVFTKEIVEKVGLLDETFTYTYDDYEWIYRIVRAGYPILCTSSLSVEHHHRTSLKDLVKEYYRSGRGCAQFTKKYPESPFTRKRLLQAILAVSTVIGCLLIPGLALTLVAGSVIYGVFMAIKLRDLRGLLFPYLDLLLGTIFLFGFMYGLMVKK